MDWREILALVLSSNGVMLLGNYLMVRKEFRHERKWNVRSEPLLRLRGELARMAQISESAIDLATQFTNELATGRKPDKVGELLRKAVKAWDECIWGGELYRTLHMQYDHELKVEVHGIHSAYQSAYTFIHGVWDSENMELRNQAVRQAKEAVSENARKVSRVQERISEVLEKL